MLNIQMLQNPRLALSDFVHWRLWSAPSFLGAVGRMAVDLGFAGIIEKFEEHWGKRATRWLLMIIGVAVVAACVGAIWTWLVAPMLAFFDTPLWGQTLAGIALKALGIGAGIALGFGFTNDLARWRRTRQLKGLLKEMQAKSDKLIRETQEGLARTREQLEKTAETNAQSRALMELARVSAIAYVEMNKELSDEERARALHQIELQRRAVAKVPRAIDVIEARKGDGKRKRAVRGPAKTDGAGGDS